MRAIVPVVLTVALLTACAPPATPDPEPAPDPGASELSPADCLVGGPWTLNLEDYASQAEAYMQGLGIPITEFTMSGAQTVQFSADGLMSVLTDVTSAGTLVTDQGPFPVSVHSTDGGSGDWAMDNDATMTITNWSTDAGQAPVGEEGFEAPVLDFSVIPSVGVTCQPGLLTLVGPESPFVPLFTR